MKTTGLGKVILRLAGITVATVTNSLLNVNVNKS